MTFGWEGFSFEHPEDWAPVTLSGNRDQGYARIASAGRLILQVRWRRTRRPADAGAFLDSYLKRLEADAKRAGQRFDSERSEEPTRTTYRYSGASYGRGALFNGPDGRAFVLEAASTKSDSLNTPLREALASFRVGGERDRWSCFGLDLELPTGLEVERKEFLAGKTRLFLKAKGVRVVAERWGFADQLLAKHKLSDWALAVLGSERGKVQEEEGGVRIWLHRNPLRGTQEAIALPQLERNQIVIVQSSSRDAKWRPQWDWLK